MTCPNRDGTIGTGGCIFCSQGGSGEFAESPDLSITGQIEAAKKKIRNKMTGSRYIAYFQNFTNTYAPVPYLEKIYREAVEHEDIVILSISTRPDCLGEEVMELLGKINQIKPVWVELGLQSIHAKTSQYIRRGYELPCFDEAVRKLKGLGIKVIVHVILGLPGEDSQDMLETIDYVGRAGVDGIKLQLLHVIRDTDLAGEYKLGKFEVLKLEEYMDILLQCIEHLPAGVVVHRITGDGPRNLVVAPMWSLDKKKVLNSINKQLREKDVRQGIQSISC
ncbi:hypothetical protein SAMN02745691_00955 [Parasporobacterium paucivorans DSM 15970]|uniref:Radical SAM core domain-containing protein n=2 Tax=Parasporobacterium TaxID=115543 RepID=A0A1M6EN44_9FIRM|nr:hypothetical protein SAMN02745691_00955 [Parasporobacterium paucivorans DSM 15970]